MKTNKYLYIGRFQPWHDGHKALVQKLLDEGYGVVIAIRYTEQDESNPFTVDERIEFIRKDFKGIEIITIPDICGIAYGRKVGYDIREVRTTDELEAISATEIRQKLADEI